MENYQKKLTNPIITWGTGLIVGILFGLIVLGWGIFPVRWVDAAPDNLLYFYQVDYLRTIIGNYGLDRDVSAAQARYYALGKNAQTALAEISQYPDNLPPELVAEFSQQVAGVPVEQLISQPLETPKTSSGLNVWIAVFLALIFLGLGLGLTYLILRGRKPAEPYETLEVGETPGEVAPEAEFEAVAPEALPLEEWQVETWQTETEEQPGSIEAEAEPEVEELFPPEKEAFVPSRQGLDLPPFLAAAAAAQPTDEEGAEVTPTEPQEEQVEPVAEEATEASEIQTDSPMGGELLAEATLAEALLEEFTGEEALAQPEETFVEEAAPEVKIESPEFETTPEVEEPSAEPAAEVETEEVAEAPFAKGISPDDPIEVKMRKKLDFIEGVGEVYAQKLEEAGITTTGKLMVEAVSRKGRQELAEKTGISEKLILRWVNHIDLYRIRGVGSEYADLLEAAGVDTVPELAQRNPDNLYQALIETNLEKRLVRQPPTPEQVRDWVEQAKLLPRIIQY